MSGDQRRLLLADSFRVRVNRQTRQAEVRGWSEHLARFRLGVLEVCAELDAKQDVETYFKRTIREIKKFGDGFPRLELWGGPGTTLELARSLRPLPELGTELELRTVPAFRLAHPRRKGPNIERLAALNRKLGAEALLTDTQGNIVEGATTSIIWWGGPRQTGHTVADRSSRVASITEKLLFSEAELTPSHTLPGKLEAFEVWAVNALHGIRVVTAIDGIPTQQANGVRLAHYRDALDRHWQELG